MDPFVRSSQPSAAQQWESLVHSRNEMFHGVEMGTRESTKKAVARFYKTLRDTLLSMTWLQGYRPFRVLSSEPTRQSRIEGNVQFFAGKFLHFFNHC